MIWFIWKSNEVPLSQQFCILWLEKHWVYDRRRHFYIQPIGLVLPKELIIHTIVFSRWLLGLYIHCMHERNIFQENCRVLEYYVINIIHKIGIICKDVWVSWMSQVCNIKEICFFLSAMLFCNNMLPEECSSEVNRTGFDDITNILPIFLILRINYNPHICSVVPIYTT